ncbi:hypothetical protein N665_0230s0047 [Sinapis alba]|nr:hypothetical protein N665_0230s0047 [Sinapis alba]
MSYPLDNGVRIQVRLYLDFATPNHCYLTRTYSKKVEAFRINHFFLRQGSSYFHILIKDIHTCFTGYALYTAFGQPSQQLRDPFEEHKD